MSNSAHGGSDTANEVSKSGSDTRDMNGKGTAADQEKATPKAGKAVGRAIGESIVRNGKSVGDHPKSIVKS
jgi:hypothetical protein